MQRERNDTVTNLPVLVPASRQEAKGFVAFQGEGNSSPVRPLRNDDLKGSRKVMAEHEAKHFYAVTMLGRALGAKPDRLAVRKAAELVSEAHALEIKFDESAGHSFSPFPEEENPEEERRKFAGALTKLLAIPAEQTAKALFGGRASGDARLLLSYEITKALQAARLVLWWDGESFKPAIWCPQLKIAFYACALMGMFRVCPHCSEPFSPERPDQSYCSVAHREAHRVARWRAKQKTHRTKARKNNGSNKTR